MSVLQTLVRWYRLNLGEGKRMLEHGGELLPCPHCARETPVYRSAYDSSGLPISFSVCLWCEGVIEYGSAVSRPREPDASVGDSRREEQRSKP